MYNNATDTMDYSVDTDTIFTNNTYMNKANIQNMSIHKNFHLVKRKIGKIKKVEIGYFTTSYIPESKIVNAVTGHRYRDEDAKCKYVVGSIHEDLLFKARISTGETGPEPVILFYDSPEEFERHQHIMLRQSIKEAWLNKKMQYQYNRRLKN